MAFLEAGHPHDLGTIDDGKYINNEDTENMTHLQH